MSKRVSIVRLSVGHFFSKWLLYPLCYYLIRYRRKAVRENLLMAFPEKSPKEICRIEKDFYLAFSDMIVEMLIGRHFSEADMRRFVVINNKEEASECCKRYGGGFFMLGHFLNWEWMVDYANQFADYGIECGTVYKRLTNSFFDRLMHRLRSRRGGFLVEMNQLLRVMVARRKDPDAVPTGYAMLADQRPRRNGTQYRTAFFNRNVGFMTGTEQLAQRFCYPVYYARYRCLGRGRYEMTLVLIYDPDTDTHLPLGTVTERFVRLLEEDIRKEPSRWLWSHRRFAGSTPVDSTPADKR